MSDATTPLHLDIKGAAVQAALAAVKEDGLRGAGAFIVARKAVLAAAPHIVAAELRRMAAEEEAELERIRWTIRQYSKASDQTWALLDKPSAIKARLLARADELDGGALVSPVDEQAAASDDVCGVCTKPYSEHCDQCYCCPGTHDENCGW